VPGDSAPVNGRSKKEHSLTLEQLREAWQRARDGQKYTLEERFFHETGVTPEDLAARREDWKIWRTSERAMLSGRHALSSSNDPESDLFLAFLLEFYWPEEERRTILRTTAVYLLGEGHVEAGNELNRMVANEIRLGHENLRWVMADPFPSGGGDPRDGKPWPPEDDCPSCPTGQKSILGPEGHHKFGCSIGGARGTTLSVVLREGGE
jgi:hypothetical protein